MFLLGLKGAGIHGVQLLSKGKRTTKIGKVHMLPTIMSTFICTDVCAFVDTHCIGKRGFEMHSPGQPGGTGSIVCMQMPCRTVAGQMVARACVLISTECCQGPC